MCPCSQACFGPVEVVGMLPGEEMDLFRATRGPCTVLCTQGSLPIIPLLVVTLEV